MNSNEQKLISIIMGIYNCADSLPQAIDSILAQTYTNWELIMCDDASTDNTYEIAQNYLTKYPDKIKLLKNEKNSSLAYSLNHCLKYSQGFYVARMDGDDYCSPDRFEKQIKFLKSHPDIDLVGTLMRRFDENGLHDIMHTAEIPGQYALRYTSCFFHATIMTYKRVYDALGGYLVAKRTLRAEDYELWFRFFHQGFKGANLQEALYFVREDARAIQRRKRIYRIYTLQNVIQGFKLLNYPKRWMYREFFITAIKLLIPFWGFKLHRKIQAIFKK